MTASQPRTGGAVVDIDRSQPSREALRWADDYARLRSLDLRAVHVWNYPSTFTFSGQVVVPESTHRGWHPRSAGFSRRGRAGRRCTGALHLYAPFRQAESALADAAEGADILVVGDSGAGRCHG